MLIAVIMLCLSFLNYSLLFICLYSIQTMIVQFSPYPSYLFWNFYFLHFVNLFSIKMMNWITYKDSSNVNLTIYLLSQLNFNEVKKCMQLYFYHKVLSDLLNEHLSQTRTQTKHRYLLHQVKILELCELTFTRSFQ